MELHHHRIHLRFQAITKEKFLEMAGKIPKLQNLLEQGKSLEELKKWQAQSGLPLKKFFNTSGQLYRSLELKDKLPEMSEDEQYRLLASDGMLVKRPIMVTDSDVLVGFKEAEWNARFTN